jgi:large subunit ribosomal protein L3
MKKIILGLKLGMSQVIKENGEVIPVTAVQIMDNMVLDVLNSDSDGAGMVLGVGSIKEKNLAKPIKLTFHRLS